MLVPQKTPSTRCTYSVALKRAIVTEPTLLLAIVQIAAAPNSRMEKKIMLLMMLQQHKNQEYKGRGVPKNYC
jgi:hypothetical protein